MASGGFKVFGAPPVKWRTAEVENVMYSRLVTFAPRVPWDVFVRDILDWRYGEHVTLIGPTGQGKTTLLSHLLPLHKYVAVMATKPRDDSMDAIIRGGYHALREWRSLDPREYPRRVIWPPANDLDKMISEQRTEFHRTFGKIYKEGGWTVAIDEAWWFSNVLGLGEDLKIYLLQGRSMGISLLAASQRPSKIPLEFYDQSTHLFFWRDNDETNLGRISGIGWRSSGLIREIVANLEEHQVLYINTRTGQMCRTRSPK